MKNQYFGDIRDLFKFDLIQTILDQAGNFRRAYYIPMLTKNDNTKHGEKRNYDAAEAGSLNQELRQFFLQYTTQREQRDIRRIEEYFRGKNQTFEIYQNSSVPWFEHDAREAYFSQVPSENLQDSLVFLDPDNGLEPAKSDQKHIRYFELLHMSEKANSGSVFMIFQYLHPARRANQASPERGKLTRLFGSEPLAIADSDVAFLFIGGNEHLMRQVSSILDDYQSRYPALVRWK